MGTASALGGSSLLPDRVPFEGRVYSATLIGGQYAITSTNLDGSGQVDTYTGGSVVTRPTLAANDDRTLLVVYGANAGGQLYMYAKQAGQPWIGWRYVGDGVVDQPQAFGGRVGVGVTVTRSDNRRWTKTTTDGQGTEPDWIANQGKLIPLGTNSNLFDAGQYPQRDTDLALLHPRVQRVRMYFDGGNQSESPRFSHGDLTHLRNNGVRTMIITLSEAIVSADRFERQITRDIGGGSILQWARNNPQVMVIIEVGNEPDRVYESNGSAPEFGAGPTRVRALDIADRWNSWYRFGNKNVEIMFALPSSASTGAATSNPRYQFFATITGYGSDGRGRVGDAYRHVSVNTYVEGSSGGGGCLDRGGRSLYGADPLQRAKAVTNGGVYVTEAGINSRFWSAGYFQGVLAPRYGQYDYANSHANQRWAELGRRYVNALEAFDTTDGRIKGVMYFQDDRNVNYGPGTQEPYNVDHGTTTGQHAHWAMGNRERSPDCAVSPYVHDR